MAGCNIKVTAALIIFATFQKGVKKIPSHKFLPLMYQLAARMGTKMVSGMAEDMGFHSVLYNVIIRQSFSN